MNAFHTGHPGPGDPVTADDGFLGCQAERNAASVVLIPVPFDATCSSRAGASLGPRTIIESSVFLDTQDAVFGAFEEIGVHLESTADWIEPLSLDTRRLVEPLLARGPGPNDVQRIAEIDAACERVQSFVFERCVAALAEGRTPGVIGGEHGVSYASIRASSESGPIGVLHVDAHLDLRDRYLGLEYSHASVMRNALDRLTGVERLVSVGIRDWSAEEADLVEVSDGRVVLMRDDDIASRLCQGQTWSNLCDEIIAVLPQRVHVSFDIDGLEPGLCPNTGTPVPGGLSFRDAAYLLRVLAESGKSVVGFDLVEVSPPVGAEFQGERTLDGVVGARVLQKLIGCVSSSKRSD